MRPILRRRQQCQKQGTHRTQRLQLLQRSVAANVSAATSSCRTATNRWPSESPLPSLRKKGLAMRPRASVQSAKSRFLRKGVADDVKATPRQCPHINVHIHIH